MYVSDINIYIYVLIPIWYLIKYYFTFKVITFTNAISVLV